MLKIHHHHQQQQQQQQQQQNWHVSNQFQRQHATLQFLLRTHFEASSMRSAASVGDCMTREAAISRLCAAAAAGVIGFAWPRPPAEQSQS
jgi:hypothetical protein